MPIKTKRWCDPREADDGFRLLICRYRPRALPKKDETWDSWCADLGLSKELHADYFNKTGLPIALPLFRERYLKEMEACTELIDELAMMAAEGKTITLLCSSECERPTHCHRTLLRELIEARVPLHQKELTAATAP